MNNFYEFASHHPILTFLLAGIIGNTIVRLVHGHPKKGDRND